MSALKERPLPKGLKLVRRREDGSATVYLDVFIGRQRFGVVSRSSVSRKYYSVSLACDDFETFYTLRAAVLFAAMPILPLNPSFRAEILDE